MPSKIEKTPLRSMQERDELILKNYKLPWYMAYRMRHRPGVNRLDLHDAAQAGYLALIRAAEHWNPSRGVKFSTYACRAIWLSIIDASVDACGSPANKGKMRKGLFPSSPKQLPSNRAQSVSHEFLYEDFDHSLMWDLAKGRSKLPRRWQRILRETIDKGRGCREVGQELGVSHESIRKIRMKALARLRKYLQTEIEDLIVQQGEEK